MSRRKQIPNQEQLSQKAVRPVIDTRGEDDFGQPIFPPFKPDKDRQRERVFQASRRDDTDKNLKIGIRDIDEAIIYYLTEVIRPRITSNGVSVEVPVQYANPEKWKAVQQDGIFRDKDGKRQLPIIYFKRDDLTRNRNITTKLDANRPHNFYVTGQRYSKRNQYTSFYKIYNRVPEIEYVYTVVPDYVKINYSCTILTDLVEQNNKIIEAINFASDSYWGRPDKFKFQAFIDSFKTDISAGTGEDRVVKTDFSVALNGYVLPETVLSGPYVNKKWRNKTNYSIDFQEKVVIPTF